MKETGLNGKLPFHDPGLELNRISENDGKELLSKAADLLLNKKYSEAKLILESAEKNI